MILSIVFVFFLIPETKGIPLESMESLFEKKPVWHAHGELLKELRDNEEQFRSEVEENFKGRGGVHVEEA